jgi:SHS2 domain-containing protein
VTDDRGHRTVPHPADVTIEAWGPSREACLAEAVMALADSFVDATGASPSDTVVADLAARDDHDRLVAVLDQVIFLLDTEGVVPLGVDVEVGSATVQLRMPVASINDVESVGASPKAVALSGLAFDRVGDQWRCRTTIDV